MQVVNAFVYHCSFFKKFMAANATGLSKLISGKDYQVTGTMTDRHERFVFISSNWTKPKRYQARKRRNRKSRSIARVWVARDKQKNVA